MDDQLHWFMKPFTLAELIQTPAFLSSFRFLSLMRYPSHQLDGLSRRTSQYSEGSAEWSNKMGCDLIPKILPNIKVEAES